MKFFDRFVIVSCVALIFFAYPLDVVARSNVSLNKKVKIKNHEKQYDSNFKINDRAVFKDIKNKQNFENEMTIHNNSNLEQMFMCPSNMFFFDGKCRTVEWAISEFSISENPDIDNELPTGGSASRLQRSGNDIRIFNNTGSYIVSPVKASSTVDDEFIMGSYLIEARIVVSESVVDGVDTVTILRESVKMNNNQEYYWDQSYSLTYDPTVTFPACDSEGYCALGYFSDEEDSEKSNKTKKHGKIFGGTAVVVGLIIGGPVGWGIGLGGIAIGVGSQFIN